MVVLAVVDGTEVRVLTLMIAVMMTEAVVVVADMCTHHPQH